MSIASAEAFMKRMKNDPEFATKIKECHNFAELQDYATKAGFDFTKEELGSIPKEFSDEELEAVSGGLCSPGMGWTIFE